jgi:hypothetical protein
LLRSQRALDRSQVEQARALGLLERTCQLTGTDYLGQVEQGAGDTRDRDPVSGCRFISVKAASAVQRDADRTLPAASRRRDLD